MTFTYRVLLKPKDILFKKKVLPSTFDNGIPLRETLQQLVNEEILLEDVPTIDVVWCKEKWAWYALNQRRLWVFQALEKLGKCQFIATKRIETVEHVNDNFQLYGSAELIGEGSSVAWDSEDGLKITVFDESKVKKEDEVVKEEPAKIKQRNWRERTPLTVKVTWDKQNNKQDNTKNDVDNTKPLAVKEPIKESIKEPMRERKDSGFSETSSVIQIEKSRAYEDDSISITVSDEDAWSESSQEKSSCKRRCRFNKLKRYRPYPRVESCSSSTSNDEQEKLFTRRSGKKYSLRSSVALRRKRDHDRWLFVLHHGNRPRREQQALKTILMNTCGYCYKSFKANVSLSQHIEELKHWSCIRCGKYFDSYTALGQHKLSLDHCNI